MNKFYAILMLAGLSPLACSHSDADAADPIADAVPTQDEADSAAAAEINEDNAEQVLADIRKELDAKP